MENQELWIDLSDIELDEVEILAQEGARGLPDFAASTANCPSTGACYSSCCMDDPSQSEV
jgi:hypothetical protein